MNQLKKYLTINSVFSLICGIIMISFSGELNTFFNIVNPYIFPVIGVNLVLFSAFVLFVSQKQLTNKILINLISGLDIIWVFMSLIIIILELFDISKNGNIIIGVIAVWILFLAYQQFKNNN